MAEWISVKERLPKSRIHVLCFVEELCEFYDLEDGTPYDALARFMTEGYYDNKRKKWFVCIAGDLNRSHNGVTHWMPLPEPPKEGGGEDGN